MLTLEEMQFLAKKRGGKCLTKTYARAIDKMTWKCAKGHIWEATGQSIKNQKNIDFKLFKNKKDLFNILINYYEIHILKGKKIKSPLILAEIIISLIKG